MADYQYKGREARFKPDDEIFRPRQDLRGQFPGPRQEAFEEIQQFDHVWLWVLMGIDLAMVLILLWATSTPWHLLLIVVAIMMLPLVFISSLKLYSRIDDEGVHYKMGMLHRKIKTIPWQDIDQIYVRKYAPLREYGGWGIRRGLSAGKAFNVKGNYGIQVVRKNGKRILIGTQDPDRASEHLNRHPLLV
jgi:hypothetical protein